MNATTNDKVDELSETIIHDSLELFFRGMCDFSVDSRGDIGSIVREVSLIGLETCFVICGRHKINLSDEIRTQFINAIVLSCFEKINRLRENAGKVLDRVLANDEIVLKEKGPIKQIFAEFKKSDFEWHSASCTIPILCRLYEIKSLQQVTILGLAINVGGLTESLASNASVAITRMCENKDALESILECLGTLLENYRGIDRVSIPLLDTINLLIESGIMLAPNLPQEPMRKIFNAVRKEVFKSKNSKKLHLAIKMYYLY